MANRDLSEDEIADLKEAFSMFDINGDGEINQRRNDLGKTNDRDFFFTPFPYLVVPCVFVWRLYATVNKGSADSSHYGGGIFSRDTVYVPDHDGESPRSSDTYLVEHQPCMHAWSRALFAKILLTALLALLNSTNFNR